MSHSRILFVGQKTNLPRGVPAPEDLSASPSVVAESVSTVQEAIQRLSDQGYDSVVCWAERQDELAAVIRIRKSSPAVPILMLTSQRDSSFELLARQLGATRVLRPDPDVRRTAELIRSAVQSGELAAEIRERTREAQGRAEELKDLARRNRQLATSARTQLRRSGRLTFVPVILEGNPHFASLTASALEKADVHSPFPILKTAEEAIAYLSGLEGSGAASPKSHPSIILLDGDSPDGAGWTVLRWIRSRPAFSLIPVVVLGSRSDASIVSRAYELGANSFVVKPQDLESHVQCLASFRSYWGSFNQGISPY